MSTQTSNGTAPVQGRLWSAKADDWAEFQELHMTPAYEAALDALGVGENTRMLDIGCGAGRALRLAADRGADVTGLDAAAGLLEHARRRIPGAQLIEGELQELPFESASFDVVTGFNSFQYAADPGEALAEAKRVTAPGGRVLALVWAPPEISGLAPHLKSLGALMPPPPPGAPGPFALSASEALGQLFGAAGLEVAEIRDVPCTFEYADGALALRALGSSGPAVRVIEHAGEEAVRENIEAFLATQVKPDGSFAIENPFRFAISRPVA